MVLKFLFWLFFLSGGCSRNHSIQNQPVEKIAQPSYVTFLVFKIEQDSSNGSRIELLNKKIVEGSMKESKLENESFDNLLVLIHHNKNTRDTIIMEHPLYKKWEHQQPEGALATKEIKIKSSEFFVRLPKSSEKSRVEVVEKLKSNKNNEYKLLATFDL